MFGFLVQTQAQNNKRKKTLTEILQIISKKQKVQINFNPGVTNRIYIEDVTSNKDVVGSINRLLTDYDLEIKNAGPTYLYVKPVKKFALQGIVMDNQSRKPLSGITVSIDGKESVCTNAGGKFNLSLRKGYCKLTIKEKSYYPKMVSVSLPVSGNVVIQLKKREQKVEHRIVEVVKEEKKLSVSEISYVFPDSLLIRQPMMPDTLPYFFSKQVPSELSVTEKQTDFELKFNLIMWGLATPNLAVEKRINNNVTAELLLGFKADKYDKKGQSISYLVQPEIKYWFLQSFNGAFIGYHTYYAHYDAGDIIPPFQRKGISENERYEGYLYGMGASCGYQWSMNKHWNIEAVAGVGYIHLAYDRISLNNSWKSRNRLDYNYFGLTKAAINLVYSF